MMEEAQRLNRRSKPRPYDLRRKVLLKNFLRQQRVALSPVNETNNDLNHVQNMDTVDSDYNLQDSNDENNSMLIENEAQLSNNAYEVESSNNDPIDSSNVMKNENVDESSFLKFPRFSNFMRLRSMSARKCNKKGVRKAKHVFKNLKSSSKSNVERSALDKIFGRNIKTRKKFTDSPPKSIFSIFKSRRSKREKNSTPSELPVNHSASCSTSCQSVQTDLTWPADEIKNYKRTNRLLREENKLLSQSLSYFMSNTSENSNQTAGESVHPSDNTETVEFLPSYSNELPTKTINSFQSTKYQSKLQRSKSVKEQSGQKITRCYRTRSLNNQSLRYYPYHRTIDSTYSPQNASVDFDYRKLRFPRSSVLKTLSANCPGRGIQRRSSMPESIRSAMCRRAGSMHTFDRKRPAIPFHSLPSQAFY